MTREEKKKAIDALKISAPVMVVTQEKFNDYIQTLNKVMNWLEQESCEDAISRQALLDAFGFSEKTRKWGGDHSGYNTMMLYEIQDIIESQPSVKPQEKTGHWIGIDEEPHEVWECDHCGFVIDGSGCIDPYDYRDTYKYCPYCGARMVEKQESEVQDADSN